MRWVLALVGLGVLVVAGCIVKDELKDGLREVEPGMKRAALARDGGSWRLEFTFIYQMGIVDEEGIEEVRWTYALVTKDRVVLEENRQPMREGQPEKTEILVEGERARSLELDADEIVDGETYVIWITLFYRGENLKEFLWPVVAGGPAFVDEDDGGFGLADGGFVYPDGGLSL